MDTAPPVRNRGGRPRLAPSQRRTERCETRLSPPERRRLDVLLRRRGTSDADVIRGLLIPLLDELGIEDPGEPEPAAAQVQLAAVA